MGKNEYSYIDQEFWADEAVDRGEILRYGKQQDNDKMLRVVGTGLGLGDNFVKLPIIWGNSVFSKLGIQPVGVALRDVGVDGGVVLARVTGPFPEQKWEEKDEEV